MIQERLNDAAIALNRVLSAANVHYGIFGGYAVSILGGVRESKDVDCLASVSKSRVIELLNGKQGFRVIPQTRQDYVAFLWSDKPDGANAVLVEIFCEQFPGCRYSMQNIHSSSFEVRGRALGQGRALFLDPFHLFKGKLRAAATRSKFHDSADLRTLGSNYEQQIRARVNELNVEYLGLAMKRYPETEFLFRRLGVNINTVKEATKNLDPRSLAPPQPGDVQKGLLG